MYNLNQMEYKCIYLTNEIIWHQSDIAKKCLTKPGTFMVN